MDRSVEMSVEAFCMAVGSNGSLLNQFVDEKWSIYLFAHYPVYADGVGWEVHRGQLVAHGNPEHPALYTRKSLNKMFGTTNIKQFFDYYRNQWDAYRRWQDEQIEADEILMEGTDGEEPEGLEEVSGDISKYELPSSIDDSVVEIVSAEPETSAGIPPSNSWYGSPDGPYNQ